MQIELLKSKIHKATVTATNLAYHGSLTVDEALLVAASLLEHEKVQVVNLNNGARIETYCIRGPRGSGVVCLNGAAARSAQPGDLVIILAYAQMEEAEARRWKPKVVFVDERNRIREKRRRAARGAKREA